jgi:hypothetical protein
MDKYTNKHKKFLFEKINSLSKTEHEEIYKILKKHNTNNPDFLINFSRNKNGIFFNLSDINDVLFEELDNFVTYCINNKKDLDDYDKKINECKINNNYNNIIHINLESYPKEELYQEKMLEDWNMIITDPKSVVRVANYVERLMNDRDRIGKKKMNVKFNNARKKFAKRVVNEKKIDADGFKDLEPESYLITI